MNNYVLKVKDAMEGNGELMCRGSYALGTACGFCTRCINNRPNFETNILPFANALSRLEFVECDTCRSKSGSPTLCRACLTNRDVVGRLHDMIEQKESMANTLEERIKFAIKGFETSNDARGAIDYIIWAMEQENNDRKNKTKE